MLQVNQVTYAVHGRILVDNVSLTFQPGKLHLVIGPNGAGKSTLMMLLSNQLQPDKGTILLGDRAMREYTAPELARFRAVLSQNIDLAFQLRVDEVVMMGRYPHFRGRPGAEDIQACTEAMEFVDVLDMAAREYLTLSGGEKQRVQFARVLAQIWFPSPNGYRYLFLDEPLTFLDIYYQFQFMQKLKELLNDTKLVVIAVVHDLNIAAKFADQVILLCEGNVYAAGTVKNVLNAENIYALYRLHPKIYRNEAGETCLVF